MPSFFQLHFFNKYQLKSIGVFASGSVDKKIFTYRPVSENFADWAKDMHPYVYHQGSVEDIQFSPKDEMVFASCKFLLAIEIVLFVC